MAIGSTMAAILGFTALAGATATSITSAMSGGDGGYKTPGLPQSPTTTDARAMAAAEAKRRRQSMSRSSSIYTSPLGISGQANIARKALLGQ